MGSSRPITSGWICRVSLKRITWIYLYFDHKVTLLLFQITVHALLFSLFSFSHIPFPFKNGRSTSMNDDSTSVNNNSTMMNHCSTSINDVLCACALYESAGQSLSAQAMARALLKRLCACIYEKVGRNVFYVARRNGIEAYKKREETLGHQRTPCFSLCLKGSQDRLIFFALDCHRQMYLCLFFIKYQKWGRIILILLHSLLQLRRQLHLRTHLFDTHDRRRNCQKCDTDLFALYRNHQR